MIYAYQLKDRNEKTGKVINGLDVRKTWQFTSDEKAAVFMDWPSIIAFEAPTIKELKIKVEDYDKTEKAEAPVPIVPERSASDADVKEEDPLKQELTQKSLTELKEFAKENNFDESEYSRLTRSKLIDYIILGMKKEDA